MFIIRSESIIEPHSYVDLVHAVTGMSLTNECLKKCVAKGLNAEAISRKMVLKENTAVYILDTQNLANHFICCILKEDSVLFAEQFENLMKFGRGMQNDEPYLPNNFELCFVLYADEWYRGQFHQQLQNNKAQVGFIDFGSSVVVPLTNIRKFHRDFAYDCVSIVCKIRNREVDMSLLNVNLIQSYTFINVTSIKPTGKFHELELPNNFFIFENNLIE